MDILFILIIGIIVFLIVARTAPAPHPHPHHSPQDGQSAMDLLRQKYINGEIDEETYLRKKGVIRH